MGLEKSSFGFIHFLLVGDSTLGFGRATAKRGPFPCVRETVDFPWKTRAAKMNYGGGCFLFLGFVNKVGYCQSFLLSPPRSYEYLPWSVISKAFKITEDKEALTENNSRSGHPLWWYVRTELGIFSILGTKIMIGGTSCKKWQWIHPYMLEWDPTDDCSLWNFRTIIPGLHRISLSMSCREQFVGTQLSRSNSLMSTLYRITWWMRGNIQRKYVRHTWFSFGLDVFGPPQGLTYTILTRSSTPVGWPTPNGSFPAL